MKKNISLLILITAILFLPHSVRAAELLTNGSFETGNFTGWTTQMTQSSAWCTSWFVATTINGCIANVTPQDGTRVALNGFDGTGGEFRLYQDVTIPTGVSARLSFMFRARWNISSGLPRQFIVQIRDPVTDNVLETIYNFTTTTGVSNGDSNWISKRMWLTQYVGQTVRLHFLQIVPQSYTGPGQFELDAVKLETFFPTSASVSIGGQVTTENGYGIRNAKVSFIDSTGSNRMATTNSFGYYSFDNVEVGNTYVFEVQHKQHQFPNNSQVITLTESRKDINFTSANSFLGDQKSVFSKQQRE